MRVCAACVRKGIVNPVRSSLSSSPKRAALTAMLSALCTTSVSATILSGFLSLSFLRLMAGAIIECFSGTASLTLATTMEERLPDAAPAGQVLTVRVGSGADSGFSSAAEG